MVDNISIDSGVSSFLLNMYRKIDKKKFQFDFLVSKKTSDRGSYEEEINSLGGHVYYFGSPLSVKGLFSSMAASKKFFKTSSHLYDIVHLHTPTIAEFTLKYAEMYGIKHRIVHSHSTMFSLNFIKKVINCFLVKRMKKYATDYWACSTEAGKFLYGESVERRKFKVVWNAIDFSSYQFHLYKRQKLRLVNAWREKKVVLHISNFTKIKNHIFLVDVIQNVIGKDRDFIFVFVGDGQTRNEFQNEIKRRGLARFCSFVGRTSSIDEYLSAADMFILPSIKEGLPVTAIEAQVNGLPCILSESITRECNLGNVIYLPFNKKKWAEVIMAHINPGKRNDGENIEGIGSRRFDMCYEIKNIERYYRDVLLHD